MMDRTQTLSTPMPIPESILARLAGAHADGGDGHGRVLVIADSQDLAEAQGWLGRGRVRLAGRRTELLGTVGLDIRRAVA